MTVGRVPVAALDPEELRRQIVLVTQEHHVFLGTVRDNLRIAAPDADDAALRGALAAVGADWAAGLPAGLDTELAPAATTQTAPSPSNWPWPGWCWRIRTP